MAALPQTLDGLVVELKARLAADPNPPADGYVLLARSYLRLGDIENGLAAFETAIELSGGDQRIITERNQVIAMLRARVEAPQIDPEAAARIRAMSPEEQAAMIQNMVDGLAARLEQEPDDVQGWLRLIQARIVLGDTDQAATDLQAALTRFADDPDQAAMFAPLAAQLADAE
jgi:cytochrome c-type biogenesis protein CcmH/NrfG